MVRYSASPPAQRVALKVDQLQVVELAQINHVVQRDDAVFADGQHLSDLR